MKRPIALATLAAIVLIASCKKDADKPNENNDALVGNYKLKHIYSYQYGVTEVSGEKAALLNDFTTINNQGTIKITSSDLEGTGLAYAADSEGTYYMFDAGVIIDSFTVPNIWQIGPLDLTAPYQLIGTDSIYFPQGSFGTGISAGQQTGIPGGGRYSWSGNTLTITQHILIDSSYVELGETVHLHGTGHASIVMEKQ